VAGLTSDTPNTTCIAGTTLLAAPEPVLVTVIRTVTVCPVALRGGLTASAAASAADPATVKLPDALANSGPPLPASLPETEDENEAVPANIVEVIYVQENVVAPPGARLETFAGVGPLTRLTSDAPETT
jgi:hypothetical protein